MYKLFDNLACLFVLTIFLFFIFLSSGTTQRAGSLFTSLSERAFVQKVYDLNFSSPRVIEKGRVHNQLNPYLDFARNPDGSPTGTVHGSIRGGTPGVDPCRATYRSFYRLPVGSLYAGFPCRASCRAPVGPPVGPPVGSPVGILVGLPVGTGHYPILSSFLQFHGLETGLNCSWFPFYCSRSSSFLASFPLFQQLAFSGWFFLFFGLAADPHAHRRARARHARRTAMPFRWEV